MLVADFGVDNLAVIKLATFSLVRGFLYQIGHFKISNLLPTHLVSNIDVTNKFIYLRRHHQLTSI